MILMTTSLFDNAGARTPLEPHLVREDIMTDEHEHERGDFIHLVDMSPELYADLSLEIVRLFGAHDVCPVCASLLLNDLAERMQESWGEVAPGYTGCKQRRIRN
jgi:hypothetical protein